MSTHTATVRWIRDDAKFTDNRYSRVHAWEFDGGLKVPASASPYVVPVPLTDPACVDPEEAYIAALSSCHMLWFLSLAAQKGFVVDSYTDAASGTMEKNAEGRLAITHVTLAPTISYRGDTIPDADTETALHHAAHERCFLANSVKTVITVENAGY